MSVKIHIISVIHSLRLNGITEKKMEAVGHTLSIRHVFLGRAQSNFIIYSVANFHIFAYKFFLSD